MKEFADDNFKFDENGKQPTGRKHCGKRRNCWLRAISPFPTVLYKDLHRRHVKPGLVCGRVKSILSNTRLDHKVELFFDK